MNGFSQASELEMRDVNGGIAPLVAIGAYVVGAGAVAGAAVAVYEAGKLVGQGIGNFINWVSGK